MIDKLSFHPIHTISSSQELKPTPAGGTEIAKQFSSFLNDAIQKTNAQENTVDQLTEQFIRGDISDVHDIMIASEKASLGLELTVQVRNKVVEAYQEIMRMQI